MTDMTVLRALYDTISEYIPDTSSLIADLNSSDYCFPCHITPTDLRPDIVYWNDTTQEVCLIELTVCFDTLFDAAAQRKKDKVSLAHTVNPSCRVCSRSSND